MAVQIINVYGGIRVNESSAAVRFFYNNAFGRMILGLIMKLHLDRIGVAFLKSPLSRGFARRFIEKNKLDMNEWKDVKFSSYRDFFCRKRENQAFDVHPSSLISPCDGYLLAYPINEKSAFSIKGSVYRVSDLLQDEKEEKRFLGGTALVFRLCPTDYHHYIYMDHGFQRENRFIPGVLHSVQPIVMEKVPVFTLNRRSATIIETENFGTMAQIEVGALIVGGIVNPRENVSVKKGEEKGYFDLCGSTIVCLFEKDRIKLSEEIEDRAFSGAEVRVEIGNKIGNGLR